MLCSAMVVSSLAVLLLLVCLKLSDQHPADPKPKNIALDTGHRMVTTDEHDGLIVLKDTNARCSLTTDAVNVQTLTMFEYSGKQIYVYTSKMNDDASKPKKWKFYYVPDMQPVQPTESDWVWAADKEVRMKLIVGDTNIEAAARRATNNKFSDELVANYSRFWDVAPLMIDSLTAYVVKGSRSPVLGVLPYNQIHPNSMVITVQLEYSSVERASNTTKHLLVGYYEMAIALHFGGFWDMSTSMLTITGDQLKLVLSKTVADGGDMSVEFIHRNQAADFVGKYLENVKTMIHVEDSKNNLSSLTAGLNEQLLALFQQGLVINDRL